MKIVLTRKLPIESEKLLGPYFDKIEVIEKSRPLTQAELKASFSDADAVICQLTDKLDAAVLESASKLRHVATFSAGVDHIDKETFRARGIKLSHTPGILTDATADLAWSLILGCARRIKPALKFLEKGSFVGFGPELFLGMELKGATLGILGMGKIGRAVAARAEGFQMKVLFSSSTLIPGSVSVETLMKESDVLSLHCPLTPKTRGLIGATELKQMKPKAILINTARGPVLDETALLQHLKANPDFFAGLDVFEKEPYLERELWELPNALCLPHIGSANERTRAVMAKICVDETIRFAKGEKLHYECVI